MSYPPTPPGGQQPPLMTPQAIYDRVKAHLLAQGAKSEVIQGYESNCLYRGPDGMRCAAGCLLPDALYDPRLEGSNVGALRVARVLAQAGVVGPLEMLTNSVVNREETPNLSLIMDLQLVHDDSEVPNWPARLVEVAAKYGLTP